MNELIIEALQRDNNKNNIYLYLDLRIYFAIFIKRVPKICMQSVFISKGSKNECEHIKKRTEYVCCISYTDSIIMIRYKEINITRESSIWIDSLRSL